MKILIRRKHSTYQYPIPILLVLFYIIFDYVNNYFIMQLLRNIIPNFSNKFLFLSWALILDSKNLNAWIIKTPFKNLYIIV